MSDFRFGLDDYGLSYYPPEASDGDGGVDWGKVERVEIDWHDFVRERTCELVETDRYSNAYETIHMLECSACGETCEHVNGAYPRCPHCGAKVKAVE